MSRRYLSIWLPFLKTDWLVKKNPVLINMPFVIAKKLRGRMVVTAVNSLSDKAGVCHGMSLADARALIPGLRMIEEEEGMDAKLLSAMAAWCIRYTPVAAVDGMDGILLESTGCDHLWGGETLYLKEIKSRFTQLGYHTKMALAPTPAAAWGMARYGKDTSITVEEDLLTVFKDLPAAALRIDQDIIYKLQITGLYSIGQFISMPTNVLRRRFGNTLIKRLAQLSGNEPECIIGKEPLEEYVVRLPCIEPVFTHTAIELAIEQLLDTLCKRLKKENKGVRYVVLKCYRVDHKTIEVPIGTSGPTHQHRHLFKMFQLKIEGIAPGFGIELFTLTATKVQELNIKQDMLWQGPKNGIDQHFAELVDRIKVKIPGIHINRYLPQEHYWPERSFKATDELEINVGHKWKYNQPRPIQLLDPPQAIMVTAPVPDYPPMFFRYKGQLHKINKADGPERIEPEWWISEGQHRDYYFVEDDEGKRYWIFRSGHYEPEQNYSWFLHGFFA